MPSNQELPTEPQTVQSVEIDSYKRILSASIELAPETKFIEVRGKNAQGKSSAIEAMMEVLGLVKAERPISNGEDSGGTRVVFQDLVIEKRFSLDAGGKTKRALSITTTDGVPYKAPAKLLQDLRGKTADPSAFIGMKPEEQVKTVLEVLGLDQELSRLEGIAAMHYDNRRDETRDAKKLEQVVGALEDEVKALPAPPEGLDLEQLRVDLAGAIANNDSIRACIVKMQSSKEFGEAVKARQANAEERFIALQDELQEIQELLITERRKWQEADLEMRRMTSMDTDLIYANIQLCESDIENKAKREFLVKTDREWLDALAVATLSQTKLDEARSAIRDLLGSVPFPLEGMAYDPDEKLLTLNDVPLSDASQRERISVAAAVAMAGNPIIQVLFIRDGSLFDAESKAELERLADERGFQSWFEVVDSNPKGKGLWVEDGVITQAGE